MPRLSNLIRSRSLRFHAVFAGLAITLSAVYLNLSALQLRHHADSLILPLMSTMKWSPFYWGQNRYGALLPLIASPIHNPVTNLLFQQFVNELCGIAVFFLMPYWLGFRRAALTAGAVSAALFLTCLDARLVTELLISQPYAVSLFLLLTGLIAAGARPGAHRPPWLRVGLFGAGAVLLFACFWVSLGLFPLAFGLCGLRIVFDRSYRGRGVRVGGILLVSLGLNLWAAQAYPVRSPETFGVRLSSLPHNAGKVIHAIGDSLTSVSHWIMPAILIAGIIAIVLARRAGRTRLLTAGCIVAGAVSGYLCFLAASSWVALNLYNPRYALPGLVFIAVIPGLLTSGGLRLLLRRKWMRRAAAVVAVGLLFTSLRVVYPPVSAADRDARWDDEFGMYTRAIMSNGVAVVYGDFRDVWPAVFHVNTLRRTRGDTNLLYGVTDRSEDTRERWLPLLRSGALAGRLDNSRWPKEPANEKYRRQAAMAAPLVFVEERRSGSVVLGRFMNPAGGNP